jgi:phage shock protein A
LFRADLHAVLDRIEEPDVVLRQAVRDMEDELAADTRRHNLLRHELQQLGNQHRDIEQGIARNVEELSVCLEADNDDLARATLRRRLEAEQLLQINVRRQQQLSQQCDLLAARLQKNRTRLQDMQQKLELLVRVEAEKTHDTYHNTPEFYVRDEDVEVALLREKQKRRQS